MRPLTVIGLMSGTSFDGVDAAVIRTDGERIAGTGPYSALAYGDDQRTILRAALQAAAGITDRAARDGVVADAEKIVTDAHIAAVSGLLSGNGMTSADIDLIGFHGQTVFHAPERNLTVQIGDAAALSRATGIPVVYDFRAADVAAGGEGAPLAPVYHRALAERDGLPRPLAVINLGGVANFTWIGSDGRMIACDTGPASAMIDDWVYRKGGVAFDDEGRIAAAGHVDEAALEKLLDHPYFDRPAPKSLDRNAFSAEPVEGLSLEDGAATLTAFSTIALAEGLAAMPEACELLVLCGGGAHNRTMCEAITRLTGVPDVKTCKELGWSGDFIEAEAFGFMAMRRMRFLPISYPGTTGVPVACLGGQIARPE